MMDKILTFSLNTRDWGVLKILRPIPLLEDPWGSLALLKGTPWGDLLPVVDGEAFSHATHGHATPLMKVIGPPPEALLRMIPKKYRSCDSFNNCIMSDPAVCYPCRKVPDCYVPPGVPEDVSVLAALVVSCWKEDRYVVIVEGAEFGY